MANIHAGEVDGKEALLMLARDLALAQDKALLEQLVIVFAPIFNADGNERLGNHRPEQAGPPQVGTRDNAAGLDLNRDFVKLETPEVRALVKFLNDWNPAVVIDCHTTNGSHHRYTLTYEGGRCPAGDPKIVDFTRDKLLPAAGKLLEERTGFKSYFYGNFRRRSFAVGDGSAAAAIWHALRRPAKPHRRAVGVVQLCPVQGPRAGDSQEFVRAVCQVTADNARPSIRKLAR